MPMPQKRPASPKATRKKVQARRNRLRTQGLRPIQIWVPDVRAPGFLEEAQRQSRLAAKSRHATDDQAFVASISAVKF
jgi:hypothetical protein